MKNRKLWYYLIFTTAMTYFILSLQDYDRDLAKRNRLLVTEDTIEELRSLKISAEQLEQFEEWAEENSVSRYEYLLAWLLTGEEKKDQLDWYVQHMDLEMKDYETLMGYLMAVFEDLTYFPVPLSLVHTEAGVSYVDSWMFERTFGGKRGHEGTDIMADINKRGRYPVISMTDGVVEQVGWLTKGGYRLGIRSSHGGYFYYAHLYDYARDFQPGDLVKAGEWIGFMGDSGYSEVEGTVGNFDVHLHVGIYVNLPDGSEMSINPYVPLQYLEAHKLSYTYY